MKKPTASNVEAFVRCTTSHAIPQHESYQAYTEKGSDGHALLSGLVNMVPGAGARINDALPGLREKIAEAMNGWEGARGEEAYVVDIAARTSQFIGINIDRKYEEALGRKLTTYEICTSLDVHARKNDIPIIRDFKFGITSSWWQLFIQAMAVLWLPHCRDSEVNAGFLFIRDRTNHFSSSDEEEEAEGAEGSITVTEEAATLYAMDLDDRADELMAAYEYAGKIKARLDAGVPFTELKTVEGKWCTYCHAYPSCPAKWKLAKSMLGLDVVGHIDALTLEQCGEAWQKLSEIKKNIIKKTEEALKARMLAQPFPMADGKVYKMGAMPARVTFKKEETIALLRLKGATTEEIKTLMNVGEPYYQPRKVKA